MRNGIFILLLSGLILPTAASYLSAQEEDGRRSSIERLESLKRMRLIEYLNLDEEESIRFFAREKEFREEEKSFVTQRRTLLSELRELASSDGNESNILETMNAIKEIEGKMLNTRWDFVAKVSDILTPAQRAKLLIFEHRFQEEIRKALRRSPRNERRKKQ